MAHFARVDLSSNRVLQLVVASQEYINSGKLGPPEEFIQYSYNTIGGVYYDRNPDGSITKSNDQSKALRKNPASVGGYYDPDADAFYIPSPYNTWELNMDTFQWEPPVPPPNSENTTTSFVWVEEIDTENTKTIIMKDKPKNNDGSDYVSFEAPIIWKGKWVEKESVSE